MRPLVGKFEELGLIEHRNVSLEERIFRDDWRKKHHKNVALYVAVVGVLCNLIAIIFIPFVATPVDAAILMPSHILQLIMIFIWFFFSLRYSGFKFENEIMLLIMFTMDLPYTYVLRGILLNVNDYGSPFIRGLLVHVALTTFSVILAPVKTRLATLLALMFIFATFWSWFPMINADFSWFLLYSTIVSFALFMHYLQEVRVGRQGLTEYHARLTSARAERAKFEREMQLAREIQDSIAPPGFVHVGAMTVRSFQEKHEKVGGDWIGLKITKDGGIVIVVADATGKGLQAALVIHAVQALWAERSDDLGFKPEEWIKNVNRTLCFLGQKQVHSLTLGVFHFVGTKYSFWSAGHPPAYLLQGEPSVQSLKVLHAVGPILGMEKDIQLTSCNGFLDPGTSFALMIGTDGVFFKGSRHSKQEMIALMENLGQKGNAALNEIAVEDDKTVVLMEHRAV